MNMDYTIRQEHAHVLKYITISETNAQPFANVRSAKIGSEFLPIGRGLLLLQIGPFCFPAYIFRDDELYKIGPYKMLLLI